MDVLDKMVNISVHQGLLVWGSTRSKFEYPLVRSLISIDPATWDNSAARESRNPLASVLGVVWLLDPREDDP